MGWIPLAGEDASTGNELVFQDDAMTATPLSDEADEQWLYAD